MSIKMGVCWVLHRHAWFYRHRHSQDPIPRWYCPFCGKWRWLVARQVALSSLAVDQSTDAEKDNRAWRWPLV